MLHCFTASPPTGVGEAYEASNQPLPLHASGSFMCQVKQVKQQILRTRRNYASSLTGNCTVPSPITSQFASAKEVIARITLALL